MSKPTATVKQLHKPRTSLVSEFVSRERISNEDLTALGPVELYSVIIEHWQECSPSAKEALMTSNNAAIRRAATMMACCQEVQPKVAVG